MVIKEYELRIPIIREHKNLLSELSKKLFSYLPEDEIPIRFVITKTDIEYYYCEIGTLHTSEDHLKSSIPRLFSFHKRNTENPSDFNAVLLIPTGIGAEIGGHAGDAGPVAKLMASTCNTLILHPNVVNASDINEMTENTLYVEGSVLTRFMMGTVGLQKVRSNRILLVMDAHENDSIKNACINSVNAARASYGLKCSEIVQLHPPVKLKAAYSSSGRAAGKIDGITGLVKVLNENNAKYDAIALTSVIDVPYNFHMDYFKSEGSMINPWGGVEALLTHCVSSIYNLPSAHSPMFENEEIANMNPGIVDPRMAAEAISMSFLQCILKGLQRSPKIISDSEKMNLQNTLTIEDVSCLVIPDGCLGLPTLAALEHGIPVIAVRENKNIMQNDLKKLPWAEDQFYIVNNYLEAIGVMTSLKSGIPVESVQRPFPSANIIEKNYKVDGKKIIKLDKLNSNIPIRIKNVFDA